VNAADARINAVMTPPGTAPAAPWRWRIAQAVVLLAAGAMLAFVIAYWGWRWFGPVSPVPASAPPAGLAAETIIAAAPFGRAAARNPSASAGASSATAAFPAETRLLGVFAGANGDGYALLRFPDRGAVLVKSGQEIAAGVRLEAVRPDGIRIRDRGEARDILLRQDSRPPIAPAPTALRPTAGIAAPQRTACAPPPGFSGPVYRLNAELLAGMAAQPQSWTALLAPANGNLVVRDETGLAAMLGMKVGDRIVQADGIALVAIDDVLTAVVKPLAASRPVRLSGTREGKPREWLFLNAGACPA
jgi:hypothetical protein